MNIIRTEQTFDISCGWNATGLEGVRISPRVKSKYSPGNLIEINNDLQEFKTKYENIYKNDVEIKEEDTIYFFKESKYPRFKFNSNCKNNKTININKATYAVIPNLQLFSKHAYDTLTDVIICNDTGNVFTCSYDHNKANITTKLENYFKRGSYAGNVVALLQSRLLISNNYRIASFEKITSYLNVADEYIQVLSDNINKCISETNLEKYLSKESSEFTNEIHDQLDVMLKSKDAGTVELGMKMLVNFDIDKSALKVGLLIRRHRENLARNKAATSVGFKNVLKQLGINLTDGVPTLNYINNLYKNTQDEENKALMLDAFRKQLHSHLIDSYENYMRGMSVPTSVEIDIK